jgi:hypothetical protein
MRVSEGSNFLDSLTPSFLAELIYISHYRVSQDIERCDRHWKVVWENCCNIKEEEKINVLLNRSIENIYNMMEIRNKNKYEIYERP